jgi:chromosome segregation protein
MYENFQETEREIVINNNNIKGLEDDTNIRKNKIDNIKNDLRDAIRLFDTEFKNSHNLDLDVERKKVQVTNLINNISNNDKELDANTGNIEILKSSNITPNGKIGELELVLTGKLNIQNEKDLLLKEIRAKITTLTNTISILEKSKLESSKSVDNIRYEISEDEKNIQEVVGQVKSIKEQLVELGINNQSILDADINYDLSQWKKKENELSSSINRMGPINLAAIDQYKEYEERKSYLTMQKEDLLSALATLEDAIKRIDKDTKERFKETFEKVDEKLQEIFPKLFNGGKAYLKMTENDLLRTGVEVFASPPGKKLTSINLLSGGEKALTALSLVFALFSLNPSPFCMLDEVDAPLDDVNIERFCNLFTEMSEKIQFIVITHKKITMEYVEQLIGVTMGEKGVSKLVNVSMKE